jgi:hypothetical protein
VRVNVTGDSEFLRTQTFIASHNPLTVNSSDFDSLLKKMTTGNGFKHEEIRSPNTVQFALLGVTFSKKKFD